VATPCRTLAGAIMQVDAHGEVIVVDSGSYAGVTIDKSVKIDVAAGAVAFSGQPIVVNPGYGGHVLIRGMTIKSATPHVGTGIDHMSGNLIVENTVIDGWEYGIYAREFTGQQGLHVRGSTIRNNEAGILSSTCYINCNASPTLIADSVITGNEIGVEVLYTGRVEITRSLVAGNDTGLTATAGYDNNAHVYVDSSIISDNMGSGLSAGFFALASICRSVVTGNAIGVERQSGVITFQTCGDNRIVGNGVDVVGTLSPMPMK
jgi:nitrous oxidase accessory protein NosD